MKKVLYTTIILVSLSFIACKELEFIFSEETSKLTEAEVVVGLKTALQVGTDTAVTVTSQDDGYYKDKVIKILLPEEAEIIEDYAQQLGLESTLDNFILSMNRAAEDAASEAGPILHDAITDLSISDGWDILNGTNPATSESTSNFDSTAATNYLISTTNQDLYNAFQPKIKTSLDKNLIEGYSTNEIWNTLTSTYNIYALGAGLEQVNTELDVYVTEEGLDGLFHKVSVEEKVIRKDPAAWAQTRVGNILEKVFGDNEKLKLTHIYK
ncbi:MAG: DUF4197 domain-containing protein [Bacteroidales bacterium]